MGFGLMVIDTVSKNVDSIFNLSGTQYSSYSTEADPTHDCFFPIMDIEKKRNQMT